MVQILLWLSTAQVWGLPRLVLPGWKGSMSATHSARQENHLLTCFSAEE